MFFYAAAATVAAVAAAAAVAISTNCGTLTVHFDSLPRRYTLAMPNSTRYGRPVVSPFGIIDIWDDNG